MTALLRAKEERRHICHARRSWKIGCEHTGKNRKKETHVKEDLWRDGRPEAIAMFTDSGLTIHQVA